MANINLFRCSSVGRPSSGLYLGNHFSRFAGIVFGLATRTTPGLVQGWVGWLAITWVGDLEDGKVGPEVGIDGEELTTRLVLLVAVLIEEVDCWEEVDWVEVNGWKGEVILLVSDSDLYVITFLHCEWMGNSKGVTWSLSLCNLVNALVPRNKEVTLYSEASGLCGFSAEMDICSTFYIKEWTLRDSGV